MLCVRVVFALPARYILTGLVLFLENIYASLPKTTRGQPIVLGGDPKGKNFLYCNGNSVIIRNIDVSIAKNISPI